VPFKFGKTSAKHMHREPKDFQSC